MTCRLVQTLLETYLDGELSDHQKVEVEAHLADCSECREQLDADRQIREVLKHHSAPTPSQQYWDQMTRSVLARTIDLDAARKADRGAPESGIVLRALAATCLSMLLLFGAIFLGSDKASFAHRPGATPLYTIDNSDAGWLAFVTGDDHLSAGESRNLVQGTLMIGPPGPLSHLDLMTDLISD